jgi:hypothetical protein
MASPGRAEARSSTRSAVSSPEDKIHRYLLLALGVVAGAALLTPNRREHAEGAADARASSEPEELTRASLDAAIAELARWIERAPRPPRTPLEANLRLLALGRSGLGSGTNEPRAALAWANLEALTASHLPAAQLAGLARDAAPDEARDGDPLATLAILLETGTPLADPLPLASGPLSARRLLELALPRVADGRPSLDPWSLDLLSFAVLGGMTERRTELIRWTLGGLNRLDREQRALTDLQGGGEPPAKALERLGAEFRQRRSRGTGGGRELQLSAAVFRAVAVLAEPELEQRALRHLNAVLFRYQLERDVYRQLLTAALDPAQRNAIHVSALEALGRLEQALYGAQLTFRRGDGSGPAPRTASSMRRAASDLIDHLDALKQSSVFATGAEPEGAPASEELIRAVTHALRGLRAARVAT